MHLSLILLIPFRTILRKLKVSIKNILGLLNDIMNLIQGNLIFRTSSDPSIELYEDYFIINGKKFHFLEVSKVLYIKGKPLWWFNIFIVFMVIITFSYEPEVTSGVNEFNVYLKDNKNKMGKNYIFKLKDINNEMNRVVEIINIKCKDC